MITCGLDFGTSNSAIGVVRDGAATLVPVEGNATLLPTAVFFDAAGDQRACFGRAAIQAYIDGADGRLMRSLKSILGSSLLDDATALGRRRVAFADVILIFVKHMKARAEAFLGREIEHVVHGRPVRFVDDDPEADARAEASLRAIAGRAGFREVSFVYEPIAAAYHYETTATREEIVLVADIGGGTSDFSLVRVGPERRHRTDRADDILANGGARIGGTDFDRNLSLDRVMPLLGLGSTLVTKNLPMPRGIYSELASWAMINFLYQPKSVREIEALHAEARQPEKTERLLATVERRLGHQIALAVEQGKIALSDRAEVAIDLAFIENGLVAKASRQHFDAAIGEMTERLTQSVQRCIADAGLTPDRVKTLFLTGGSSQVPAVRKAIAAAIPAARIAGGSDFLSVALGLTERAARLSR